MNKKTVVAIVTAVLIAAAAAFAPVGEVLKGVCAKVDAPVEP